MIETKDLTNFAQHLFSHGRGARRARFLYPEREWFVIITLFLVVFLSGAVLSVWYNQLYKNLPEHITGREAVSVPAYEAAAMEQVHTMYRTREEQYQSLYDAAAAETAAAVPEATGATSTELTSTASSTVDGLEFESSSSATATIPNLE